jgi:hypothetical protein
MTLLNIPKGVISDWYMRYLDFLSGGCSVLEDPPFCKGIEEEEVLICMGILLCCINICNCFNRCKLEQGLEGIGISRMVVVDLWLVKLFSMDTISK